MALTIRPTERDILRIDEVKKITGLVSSSSVLLRTVEEYPELIKKITALENELREANQERYSLKHKVKNFLLCLEDLKRE